MNEIAVNGLIIGHQFDNKAYGIVFPVKDFFDAHGKSGTFSVFVKRFGDEEGYPVGAPLVSVDKEKNEVTWTVTSGDVSIPGPIEFQLRYTIGTVCVMSVVYKGKVNGSIVPGGTAPEPMKTWADAITAEAQRAVDAVNGIPSDYAEALSVVGEDLELVEKAVYMKKYNQNTQPDGIVTGANRWFLPVLLTAGSYLKSIKLFLLGKNAESTLQVELWNFVNGTLTLRETIDYENPIVSASEVNIHFLRNVNIGKTVYVPTMISLTSNIALIGTTSVPDAKLLFADKSWTEMSESAFSEYSGRLIAGEVDVVDNASEYIEVFPYGLNFSEGIERANSSRAKTVYVIVKKGTYNLIDEYGLDWLNGNDTVGPTIKRGGIKVIFEQGAKVTAHYTGTNAYIRRNFSILNSNAYDLHLEHANFEASNIRYCVHDEHATFSDPYTSFYKDCVMSIDNSGNTEFGMPNALGVGLGVSGHLIVDGGEYSGKKYNDGSAGDNVDIRIHNSESAYAESYVNIRNAFFKKGVGFMSFGTSVKNTMCYVSGCSLLRINEGFSTGATTKNMLVRAWGNEIRG